MNKLTRIPLLLLFTSCTIFDGSSRLPKGVECLSLTGDELRPPEVSVEKLAELAANLQSAEVRHAENPKDEMAAIWHGRRLAYLGRYNDAIEVYTAALLDHPTSYRLHRHRGHRYISTRQFQNAIKDLRSAATLARGVPDEYEQDGAPNEYGIPRSTTQSNIYYHLALALYLERNFLSALDAWERCLYFSRVNDDMFVAASYWTVLTLWRLDRSVEAKERLDDIHREMDILENADYHRLLLLFRGDLSEGDLSEETVGGELSYATVGFGLGAWHLANGRESEAQTYFSRVVAETFWPAFGHIAAEVEVASR